MHKHVKFQLVFKQRYILCAIHRCFGRQKVETGCTFSRYSLPISFDAGNVCQLGWCIFPHIISLYPTVLHSVFPHKRLFDQRVIGKSTFFRMPIVQRTLANLWRFFFMTSVRRGFRAGTSPNSENRRH